MSVTKLLVTNAGINVQVPLSMNTYQLSGIPTPINDDQCPNKLYVDTKVANIASTYATITQVNEVDENANSKLSKSRGLINGNVIIQEILEWAVGGLLM